MDCVDYDSRFAAGRPIGAAVDAGIQSAIEARDATIDDAHPPRHVSPQRVTWLEELPEEERITADALAGAAIAAALWPKSRAA